MKGFFITVKNGLLETKHQQTIGEAIWLFLWLLDKMTVINHDTGEGKVLGGKPIVYNDVYVEIGVSMRQYRRWVKVLEDSGYIKTLRTPRGLCFTVYNSFKVFNQKSVRSNKNGTSDDTKKAHQGDKNGTSNIRQYSRQDSKTIQSPSAAKPASDKTIKTEPKRVSDHAQLVYFFHDAVVSARGIKPVYTRADFSMLKRILDKGIKKDTLEQSMIFFLYDLSFKTFSPTLKTFLSAGVITGILNRMKNDNTFWKQLDNYAQRQGFISDVSKNPMAIAEIVGQLADLKKELLGKMTNVAIAIPQYDEPVIHR